MRNCWSTNVWFCFTSHMVYSHTTLYSVRSLYAYCLHAVVYNYSQINVSSYVTRTVFGVFF